jgi:hypothetical protein
MKTCDYRIKPDGGGPQRPCGRPATHSRPVGGSERFYYCDTCAANAREECRRVNIKINLTEIPEALR